MMGIQLLRDKPGLAMDAAIVHVSLCAAAAEPAAADAAADAASDAASDAFGRGAAGRGIPHRRGPSCSHVPLSCCVSCVAWGQAQGLASPTFGLMPPLQHMAKRGLGDAPPSLRTCTTCSRIPALQLRGQTISLTTYLNQIHTTPRHTSPNTHHTAPG